MEYFALTDTGRTRDHNEDSLLAEEGFGVFAVADGMGGQRAGETASATAIDTLRAFYRRVQEADEMSWPYGFDPGTTLEANRLATAIRLANRRVWKLADTDLQYTGMGTTLVVIVLGESGATIGGVGDSRVYRWRSGQLRQLTEDDTVLTQELRRQLGPERVAAHPYRNILTSAIGAREEVEVDVSEHALEPGDLFLLCSDGLHSQVDDAEIARALEAGRSLQETARVLVDAANQAGGRDNVTVLLVRP
jgi:protein phosphatase